jgi:hypothetical protein
MLGQLQRQVCSKEAAATAAAAATGVPIRVPVAQQHVPFSA